MIKVFISSPYTIGDVARNVKNAMDTADQLITAGFAPFCPLYSHFQHIAHPRPYVDWTRLDMEWLKVCDCILRLPGESAGADQEVMWFRQHTMKPVFYMIADLVDFYKRNASDLQPKECDHELSPCPKDEKIQCTELNKSECIIGTCKLGADWPITISIKPDPQPSQEKHCTHCTETIGCPYDGYCEGCDYWQPVEPAEKRYIVVWCDPVTYTLDEAKKEASEHPDKVWVARVIAEQKTSSFLEWHEEQ